VSWPWIILGCGLVVLTAAVVGWCWLYFHIRFRLLQHLLRIFQERPLFNIPRGQPLEDAENVTFRTEDGLTLTGCYLKSTLPTRQGVILFGIEFGSNRWACVSYCQFLLDAGFDIFSFEYRNQGDSDHQPGYDPLQWVTDFEVRDFRAAIAYLKARPDADPNGFGFFGISKGGSAGVLAAVDEPAIRCCVTDGIFATHTTMVPYMRRWIAIYSRNKTLQMLIPDWYYLMFAKIGLKKIEKERNVQFPRLEKVMHGLSPRPLLMIHGGNDTYIKPEMAQALFNGARQPKEFWLVEGAKHNQAFHLANEEYSQRVLKFFQTHLAVQDVTGSVHETAAGESEPSPLMAES
jgi:dipeptidyl aminopeptidase/acylaminoacyl peptidase